MSTNKLTEVIYFLKTMQYNFDALVTNDFKVFANRAYVLMLSVTQMKRYLNQNKKYKKLLMPPLEIISAMLTEIARRLATTSFHEHHLNDEKYVYNFYKTNLKFVKNLEEYFKYKENCNILINKNYKLLKIIVTKYKRIFFKQTTLYKSLLDFYP
jgi:hypothetical protein